MIEAPAPGGHGYSVAPWQAEPYRVWSLLEMLQNVDAEGLMRCANALGTNLTLPLNDSERAQWQPNVIEKLINDLRPLAEHLGLRATLASVRTLETFQEVKQKEVDRESFFLALEDIRSRLIDELNGIYLFAMEPREKTLYENTQAFGPEVAATFPGAIVDIEEAAKCLAFDRATACVFHLMRVLEVGLQGLAKDLGLPKVDRNWQALLNNVRGVINKLPLTTQAEKDYQSDRQEVVVHLQAVKDAWRNDVMHPRDHYDLSQALDIFNHTRPLMQKLAALL
ncbi:hypothetical protein LCGC14_2902370 [marine sediment metagenome]|uniref:Uncharacterized protein n=1 Tax=marine sediment metagenome TaxID=412755 RepID=A0A0F8XUF9_9ZZZZ